MNGGFHQCAELRRDRQGVAIAAQGEGVLARGAFQLDLELRVSEGALAGDQAEEHDAKRIDI